MEAAVGLVGIFFNPAIGKPMGINVCVWLILFLASRCKLAYDRKKLKNLKQAGVCADSEIEEMLPAAWFRVGNYVTCRIACRFTYEGREYRAVSNYYVLTPFTRKEDLCANVYIDREDPAQYSVELFRTGS